MSLHVAIVNPILRTPTIVWPLVRGRVEPIPASEIPEVNIVELGKAVADLGHRVTIFVADAFLETDELRVNDRVTVCAVPARLPGLLHPALLPFTPSLRHSARLREADVIQSGEFHQPTTFFASRLAAGADIPFLVWQEAFHHMQTPGRWYEQFYECTGGRPVRTETTRFILRTTKARAYLQGIGVPPSVIGPWIPTGIDGESFQPRPGTFAPEDFGFPEDCALVTVVARLSPDKGVDLAIAAVALLKKRGTRIGLLIRGSGPNRGELEALAKREGIEDCVRFLGRQSRMEMAKLYNSSELFLSTSRADLLPFSLLEAGGCGLPSVTAGVGCVTDFVQDGVNGLLVPPGSVEAIASGMSRLLADDGLREAMGKAARRRFAEAFDVRVTAPRLVKVYEEALDGGNPADRVGGDRA